MRIVLDAMGSDQYPVPDIAGAVMAARQWPDDEIILVGREDIIRTELQKHDTQGLQLEIVPATEVIEMDDPPAWAAKE